MKNSRMFEEEKKSSLPDPAESSPTTKQFNIPIKGLFDKSMAVTLICTIDLAMIAHTLLAANLVAKCDTAPGIKQQAIQHAEEEEKTKKADISQLKTIPTLLETYKESETMEAKANIYQLPESPDATLEPLPEGSGPREDKNAMSLYCEKIYKNRKKVPFAKAFAYQKVPMKPQKL